MKHIIYSPSPLTIKNTIYVYIYSILLRRRLYTISEYNIYYIGIDGIIINRKFCSGSLLLFISLSVFWWYNTRDRYIIYIYILYNVNVVRLKYIVLNISSFLPLKFYNCQTIFQKLFTPFFVHTRHDWNRKLQTLIYKFNAERSILWRSYIKFVLT